MQRSCLRRITAATILALAVLLPATVGAFSGPEPPDPATEIRDASKRLKLYKRVVSRIGASPYVEKMELKHLLGRTWGRASIYVPKASGGGYHVDVRVKGRTRRTNGEGVRLLGKTTVQHLFLDPVAPVQGEAQVRRQIRALVPANLSSRGVAFALLGGLEGGEVRPSPGPKSKKATSAGAQATLQTGDYSGAFIGLARAVPVRVPYGTWQTETSISKVGRAQISSSASSPAEVFSDRLAEAGRKLAAAKKLIGSKPEEAVNLLMEFRAMERQGLAGPLFGSRIAESLMCYTTPARQQETLDLLSRSFR